MSLSDELIAWGPAVTLVLAFLLLSKELLLSSQEVSPWLRWGLNAAIVPLLLLFFVQIALLVLSG